MLTRESALRKDHTSGTHARMEHRHFAWIAATIREMPEAYRDTAARHFADACERSNPRFDRRRFMAACE